MATSGQIRAAIGGIDGFGFEMRARNGDDSADLIALSVYNQTLIAATNVFTMGGYGLPENAPDLRVDHLNGDFDPLGTGGGAIYTVASTLPTPEAPVSGVAVLALWNKVGPIVGYPQRRMTLQQKHTNRGQLGVHSSLPNPETILAMGEGVDGREYCSHLPQPGYLTNSTCSFPYSATGDVHYLREDGQYRSMFGDGTSMDFAFAGDADDTLTFDESLYDMYFVLDGTITQKRKITSPKTPTKTSRAYVRNLNTFDVDFAWSAGAAVTVPSGHWAIISARGGAAYVFASGV